MQPRQVQPDLQTPSLQDHIENILFWLPGFIETASLFLPAQASAISQQGEAYLLVACQQMEAEQGSHILSRLAGPF